MIGELALIVAVLALVVAIGPDGRRRERDHWRTLADRDRKAQR